MQAQKIQVEYLLDNIFRLNLFQVEQLFHLVNIHKYRLKYQDVQIS